MRRALTALPGYTVLQPGAEGLTLDGERNAAKLRRTSALREAMVQVCIALADAGLVVAVFAFSRCVPPASAQDVLCNATAHHRAARGCYTA